MVAPLFPRTGHAPGPDERIVTVPPSRRALFVVNPRARRGAGGHAAVRRRLEEGGIALLDVPWTAGARGAGGADSALSELLRRRSGDADLVVVGGGDGTLNSAARGLYDTQLPLGILPLGTANDFARTLGIPADPLAAADLIVAGAPRAIDLGEVNGHLFLNVASIGFSADLARALTAEAKRRFGVLGYGVVAARLLWQSRPFTAFIEHDGRVETVRTLQVSVGNGRYYGGGLAIAADATADDGALDFYSLEVAHWWHLLALLPSLRRGTLGQWKEVRSFRTTSVVVRTSRPRAVNTDGELVTFTPATFGVRRGAIRVYAPPPRSAAPAAAPAAVGDSHS